ncbi:MAG: tetratricopeptide repeat protein [Flavipsychrobacter sp.]|nr:tetratricopeptide repeat protein [Flavipsychrobacter sp.]
MILAASAITLGAGAQSTSEGVKLYNYHKFKSAQAALTPLAEKDALANYYLGLSYLESGDAVTANTTFLKFPEDPANISGTARVAFVNKDAAKGMQIAKGLAAKGKKKDWVQEKYAADAITYTDGGDYQQAIAWYTDALTKTDDADIHIGLGDVYRKTSGGGGNAMNNYEHVTEKDAKNSLAFTRIGDLWYEAHNYPSALDNYAKAKDADATNPLPYKELANAYTRSGRYQQALENIKKYIDLSDNTASDKLEYLRALYRAQSSCDAAKYAQDLLNGGTLNNENKTEAMGILGYSQADCGDSVQALKNLRSYFGMQDPKKIMSGDYIQLGRLFLKLDMLDSAGFYYTKGISGDTARNKTDVYRTIADAFKAKKDYCKSADWYDNLVKANPETQAGDYAWRAIMFYYCKDLNKAMAASNEFFAKYPTQPSAPYWQARTAAAIDSEATTGGAVPYYIKWLDVVGPNYEKKNDLKAAYEYLMYYYYNKKDKENVKMYIEKVRTVDPANKAASEIEAADKVPAVKPAPAKPKK